MPSRSQSRLALVLLAVAAILGVGVATYFLGRPSTTDEAPDEEYVQLDLSTVSGSDAPAEQVLYLPWGDGPAEASRKGSPVRRSTIEAVFGSEGYTFVVDHPEGVFGARVRWFSAEGALVGTRLAPGGSKAFRPHPGGYNYVIAKTAGPSEVAVIVDVASSTETTFTIPLNLNTGGLDWAGDTLYASIAPSDVSFENEVMYLRHALVPVAVGGVQVDDAAADAGVVDAWGFGMDGKPYTSTMKVLGLSVTGSEIVNLVGSGDRLVRVPRKYRLLGVTADSKVCLSTLPPEPSFERPVQAAPAWIAEREPYDEVIVMSLDGTIVDSIVFPYSSVVARYDATLPMSLSADGLYTLRADEGGVAVVVHPFE